MFQLFTAKTLSLNVPKKHRGGNMPAPAIQQRDASYISTQVHPGCMRATGRLQAGNSITAGKTAIILLSGKGYPANEGYSSPQEPETGFDITTGGECWGEGKKSPAIAGLEMIC